MGRLSTTTAFPYAILTWTPHIECQAAGGSLFTDERLFQHKRRQTDSATSFPTLVSAGAHTAW